eukprot:349622-Chlamydomonas_euryale.AAC.5
MAVGDCDRSRKPNARDDALCPSRDFGRLHSLANVTRRVDPILRRGGGRDGNTLVRPPKGKPAPAPKVARGCGRWLAPRRRCLTRRS